MKTTLLRKTIVCCILMFAGMSLFTACSDDDEKTFNDFLNPAADSEAAFNNGLSFDNEATSQQIGFEAGQAWTATLTGVEGGWCQVSPEKGGAGEATVTVTVTQNETDAARTAQLTIASGSQKLQLAITQSANAVLVPEGLSYAPETPDADQPLTLTFKAAASSALYGYDGEVYVHIGVVDEGSWMFVPADWGENIEKCKMTANGSNVWSITLNPTVREWFGSGTTPVKQLGVVIRSADGNKKGIEDDSFIPVTDTKYEGFVPGEVQMASLPSGVLEGINVVDNSTVTLVLYDKDNTGARKDFAYVVGDFNDWTLSNDDKSQMYRDDAAGCWWITLSGLEATREYAFQYYVGTADGETIRLADAYAEKILDPDNDQYIPASTYNEDMTYPEGGRGIVSTFKIEKDNYAWKVTDFKIAGPEQLVIYELHLRDFTASSDLNGAMERLDYLTGLGVNAIELMPVQEFDGNDSWGYNPCFFFAMDKAYGTKQMYKQFIDACHERGMAVILDVVYNHATGNHPFAKLYWDGAKNQTAANNPYFNVEAPHPYSVYHDFNHESELVRKFVKRNLQFLLEEYKLDGFRFDLTKGFTQRNCNESTTSNYDASRVAILTDYHAAIREVKEDAFVVLEHFCDTKEEQELAEDGLHLWRNLNNAYCQSAMGWCSDSAFGGMYEKTPAWVGFMESHDEERMSYKQSQWGNYDLQTNLGNRMKQLEVNTAFCLTVPGPKMIWQFGELGYDVSIDENGRTGRKPLHWEYLDDADRKALHDTYAELMQLRNANPELFDSSALFDWDVNDTSEAAWNSKCRWLSIESTTGKRLVVVGNFTDKEKEADFPGAADSWSNYFTGESLSGGKVNVPAHGYLLYTNF